MPLRRGKPYVYPPKVIVAAMVVMIYRKLDSLRGLARVLADEPTLALACGFGERTPNYRTFARRFKTLDEPLLSQAKVIAGKLIDQDVASLSTCAIDSTILKAKGIVAQKITDEHKTITPTDRDAAWGYCHSKGFLFGYKLHATSTTGKCIIPLSWSVTGANMHDSTQFIPLAGKVSGVRYWVGDKGYDVNDLYRWAEDHETRFTTPVRRYKNPRPERAFLIAWYESNLGQHIFRRRSDIERLFGTLKDTFLLDPLPVIGRERVTTYIGAVFVAYLAGIYYNYLAERALRALKSIAA